MAPKWVGFIIFVWVCGSILGAVIEHGYLGSSEQTVLNRLMGWQEVDTAEQWGIFELARGFPEFLGALWHMLTFRFAFLDGDWEIFRWIVLAPIIGTVVFGIVLTFINIMLRVLT